jgi:3-methyladenine DNA glycosylase AlkC
MKPRGVENLKDVIDEKLLIRLSNMITDVFEKFDSCHFVEDASRHIQEKSFFERIVQAANSLHVFLPDDFEESTSILLRLAAPPLLSEGYGTENYYVLILSRYISLFGLDYPQISLPALGRLTQSYTAEFDIRPFIERYPKMTFAFLQDLARSECFHQRRLASEGCRPRLPLATHLTCLKEEPQPCINILTMLRKDPIRYVQKSVANNLSDILKDNPYVVYKVFFEWVSEGNQATNWIIGQVLRKRLQEKDKSALVLYNQLTSRTNSSV